MGKSSLFAGVFLLTTSISAQCFFPDGELAIIGDQSYVQCPGTDFCCVPTDTCDANGLCVDVNNHADGSLTTSSAGTYNFTGLYQTAACTNKDWTGCQSQCSSAQSSSRAYVWSCDDENTEFCCAGDAESAIMEQRSCCSDSTNFELAALSASVSSSSTTTMPMTSTAASSTGTPSSKATSGGSSGLSEGAKIGIGVGVAGGILAIAVPALIVCLLLRKKRARRSSKTQFEIPPSYEPMRQSSDSKLAAYTDTPVRHMQPKNYPAEMDAQRPGPVEAIGDVDYGGRLRSHELA